MIFTRLEVLLYIVGMIAGGWVLYPSEYTRGLMLRQQGDRSEAIAFFGDYLKRNPYHKGATLALMQAYEEAGRPEEAIEPLELFYAHRRGDLETGRELLALMNRTGLDARAALFRWELVRDLERKPQRPREEILRLYFDAYRHAAVRQETVSAKRALLHLAELDPEEGVHRDRLVRLLLGQGDPKVALKYLDEKLAENPDDQNLRRLIARIHRAENRRFRALAVLSEGLNRAPRSVALLTDRLRLYTEIPNLERVIDDLRTLKELEPRRGLWVQELGNTLIKAEHLEEGLKHLEAYQARNPGDKKRWWSVIYALDNAKMRERAAEKLENYLRAFPKDNEGFEMLVFEYHQLGRTDKQIEALQRRLEAVPDDFSARKSLISRLTQEERYDDCVAHYEILIAQRPEDPKLRMSLGYLQNLRGDMEASVRAYREHLRRFPDDKIAMDKLVYALTKMGRHDEAIKVLSTHLGREEGQ